MIRCHSKYLDYFYWSLMTALVTSLIKSLLRVNSIAKYNIGQDWVAHYRLEQADSDLSNFRISWPNWNHWNKSVILHKHKGEMWLILIISIYFHVIKMCLDIWSTNCVICIFASTMVELFGFDRPFFFFHSWFIFQVLFLCFFCRVPTPVSVLISAAVFALAHLTPGEFPQLFVLGKMCRLVTRSKVFVYLLWRKRPFHDEAFFFEVDGLNFLDNILIFSLYDNERTGFRIDKFKTCTFLEKTNQLIHLCRDCAWIFICSNSQPSNTNHNSCFLELGSSPHSHLASGILLAFWRLLLSFMRTQI